MSRALPGVAAASVVGVSAAAWPYTVDDAFVLARYARRIAGGQGYTFIDGPASDGVTGPLGLVPGLLGELAFGDPVLGAKIAGGCAAAGAAAWVVHRAGREGPGLPLASTVLLALWPLLGIWAVAGLETGLATLAATGVAIGLVDRRPIVLGACVACLAWLRPEAALPSLAALVMLGRERRPASVAWGLAALGALGVVGFRLALFGSPLPLSALAKPPDLINGLGYALRALLLVVGIFGMVPIVIRAREEGGPGRRLVVLVGIAALSIVLAGGDWMPGFRLFVPWLPALAWIMAGPIATLWQRRRGMAVLMMVGATALPSIGGGLALLDARAAGRIRDTDGAALAGWLEASAERVALVDIGYLAYASGVDVVDLGGITDPEVARLPGGHVDKRIDPAFLRSRDPDTIVVLVRFEPGRPQHPVERRVLAMGWVRSEMRVVHRQPYGRGAAYVVLQR